MPFSNIDKPSSYFNTKLYTGTGATNSVTGVGFKPDWTWIKTRNSGADWHRLIDAVRGVTKELYSNATNAESTQAQSLQTFNTDGFTLGTLAEVNANGNTFVSWNWLGSNTTASNTSGTISSTVSANTTSGFSIVSYTGNGTSGATIGHGLGVVPAFTIVKNRSSSGTNWQGFHKSLGNTKSHLLNSIEVPRTSSIFWNNTSPTSTLITLGNDSDVNINSNNYIAYCFAEVKGFSKAFSYTGNGSADGSFVYCGFKPAFIMTKNTSQGASWFVYDNKRSTYNPSTSVLAPNASDSEADWNTTRPLDILSNGFKLRVDSVYTNTSGNNYIGIAFAENPFCSSKGIPTCAR